MSRKNDYKYKTSIIRNIYVYKKNNKTTKTLFSIKNMYVIRFLLGININ